MKRVPYEVMVNEFERVLTKYGFEPKDAKASAELFAQNSMAGVYSHGLNRFPRAARTRTTRSSRMRCTLL